MRVAVTGASGFIGRHVLSALEHYQVEVFAVTRDATRLKDVAAGVRVVEMDIASPMECCFTHIGSPDVLIHLAWDGLSQYSSLHHFEVELPNQYNFLKKLIEAGLPSVLVTGTCFEYGMQSGALSEMLQPCPITPYGFAKHALHQQLAFLRDTKPYNLVWGRLFYMYGEGQSHSSLYSKLRDAVLRGDKVFDMSGGEQLRDYLPVRKVARAIIRLALSGCDMGDVNICSGEPVSIRRLVEQWRLENSWEIELNMSCFPYPDYEPMAFWGDTTKMRKVLGDC